MTAWELHQERIRQAKAAMDAAWQEAEVVLRVDEPDPVVCNAAVDRFNALAVQHRALLTTILPADELEST